MHRKKSLAGGLACLLYGVACYALFIATLLYLVGFVGDCWRWLGWNGTAFHSLDQGGVGSNLTAVAADLVLVVPFALQHSVMARAGFKRRWVRFVDPAIERSTYVLAASLCLVLLCWQWRPIGGPRLWDVSGTLLEPVLLALSAFGWLTALVATFLIDHLELFGLRQVWSAFRGRPRAAPRLAAPGLYRAVRHPLYLGFLIAFWAAPAMSPAHLVFAAAFTAYVLAGIRLEERDLVRAHGDDYREYRRATPMLLPFRWRRSGRKATPGAIRAGAPSPLPSSRVAPSPARTAS